MHIAYTPAQEELRRELRAYFAEIMTPEIREQQASGETTLEGRDGAYWKVARRMGRDGWLGIGWPKEYGGQDRSMMEQLIFTDEATLAGAAVPFLTINTIGPTIMEYGTQAQRDHFLPRILSGELHFSIGYSEPEAGTDLANLRTRAVRDGDDFVVNGQKMWISLIHVADYLWLAARTDPDVKAHKGLTIFLVPTDTPGLSWSEVRTLGGQTVSQLTFEDMRVPASAVVGEVNGGWGLMTGQLNRERVALCSAAGIQLALHETRRWAEEAVLPDGRRVIDQEHVQANLGRVHAKVEFLKLINWKIAWAVDHGAKVGPADASATKIFGTEFATEAYRLLMECFGENASLTTGAPGVLLRGRIEKMYRSALILTFGGGTNEIQRDMIAMLGLRMPRPPR
ncbi:acyl-CoA dehydrogenase family protein [Yinghuangia sp. ASG 101]|uniref:acyl-CoA dehydrogenase family protein n=1 Tax=Yinghuangia sp. ASG 101 TaxID=2896848 RepID=UPI001E34068F|nr:acyl-CoA dehydrogenase family protein [Yinghuangia sp. ASG 101]UGQ10278.1 acyl-CoA dehydrogenase family protein [Yinghuangia sp. ASG 101]